MERHGAHLAALPALTESYFRTDPSTALIKPRQFAQLLEADDGDVFECLTIRFRARQREAIKPDAARRRITFARLFLKKVSSCRSRLRSTAF
jgi:hypothetical protein